MAYTMKLNYCGSLLSIPCIYYSNLWCNMGLFSWHQDIIQSGSWFTDETLLYFCARSAWPMRLLEYVHLGCKHGEGSLSRNVYTARMLTSHIEFNIWKAWNVTVDPFNEADSAMWRPLVFMHYHLPNSLSSPSWEQNHSFGNQKSWTSNLRVQNSTSHLLI